MSGSGVDPRWFKQAQRGLYAGKQRLSGNHVSASKRHVRRHWMPNVQRSHLWSDILNRQLSLNVTVAALRQVDRKGGLDNYILGTPALHSQIGDRIRAQMLSRLKSHARLNRKCQLKDIRRTYDEATPEQKIVIEATLRAQLMAGSVPTLPGRMAAAPVPAPDQQMQ